MTNNSKTKVGKSSGILYDGLSTRRCLTFKGLKYLHRIHFQDKKIAMTMIKNMYEGFLKNSQIIINETQYSISNRKENQTEYNI